jgi:hypothetical protein
MKKTVRNYRGRIIESFNLRALGDPTVRGMAYAVYADADSYASGVGALSARENLMSLHEAKSFVDSISAK